MRLLLFLLLSGCAMRVPLPYLPPDRDSGWTDAGIRWAYQKDGGRYFVQITPLDEPLALSEVLTRLGCDQPRIECDVLEIGLGDYWVTRRAS